MSDPEIKRAYDGSPLWRCSKCGKDKKRKDMALTRGDTIVCHLCHTSTIPLSQQVLRLPWLVATTPPGTIDKRRIRAIWKHVRPVLCYYGLTENRKAFQNDVLRDRVMERLFYARRAFQVTLREPILKAVADYDLDPQLLLWLSVRDGVFDACQLRRLAIEVAEQAVQATKLTVQYPTANSVLTALHRFVSEENTQLLNVPRQTVYAMQQTMTEDVFVLQPLYKAAQALSTACFTSSHAAAVATLCATHEALEGEGYASEVILANLADPVRALAQEALRAYELPAIEHWRGLEEV